MKLFISVDRARLTYGDIMTLLENQTNPRVVLEIVSQHVIDEETGNAVSPEDASAAMLRLPLDEALTMIRSFSEQVGQTYPKPKE